MQLYRTVYILHFFVYNMFHFNKLKKPLIPIIRDSEAFVCTRSRSRTGMPEDTGV
jgi:hypothetical protein